MGKGAIYHYVKSKDELFAIILESGLEETNEHFFDSVAQAVSQEKDDMELIKTLSKRLHEFTGGNDAIRLIYIYLLTQENNPTVAQILNRYYETSIMMSKRWIEVGKEHNVIPEHIDAEKAARMLNIFKDGLLIQHIVSPDSEDIQDHDIYQFFLNTLGVKN